MIRYFKWIQKLTDSQIILRHETKIYKSSNNFDIRLHHKGQIFHEGIFNMTPDCISG